MSKALAKLICLIILIFCINSCRLFNFLNKKNAANSGTGVGDIDVHYKDIEKLTYKVDSISNENAIMKKRIQELEAINTTLENQLVLQTSEILLNYISPLKHSEEFKYDEYYDGAPVTGEIGRWRIPNRFRNCIIIISDKDVEVSVVDRSISQTYIIRAGQINLFCDSTKFIKITTTYTNKTPLFVRYRLDLGNVYKIIYKDYWDIVRLTENNK